MLAYAIWFCWSLEMVNGNEEFTHRLINNFESNSFPLPCEYLNK
jgi:hypothetical protein